MVTMTEPIRKNLTSTSTLYFSLGGIQTQVVILMMEVPQEYLSLDITPLLNIGEFTH